MSIDFSEFGEEDRDFVDDVVSFLRDNWSEERLQRVLEGGASHDPVFLRALGERGWVLPDWPADEGGAALDDRRYYILNSLLALYEVPPLDFQMTRMVAPTVRSIAGPDLRAEVLPKLTAGLTGISLGYTEPEGGSDIAAARTRAVRDGDDWVINGGKVFTTHAHVFEYCFLLTLTDPEAPRARGLTMFLVPMSTPGIDVNGLETLGERTNIVTYTDVRVPDRYRLGTVNDGWSTLMGPLNIEHGTGSTSRPLLDPGLLYARQLATAFHAASVWATSGVHPPISSDLVAWRLGAVALALAEASATWGTSGRVHGAEALIQGSASLIDLLGGDAIISGDTPGGVVERTYRWAQVSATYGGTTEVYRNMIARELGLPRPLGG